MFPSKSCEDFAYREGNVARVVLYWLPLDADVMVAQRMSRMQHLVL